MTDKGETDNNNGGRFRRETIHHQHRRSYWHDYHELGLYMLTMVIEGRQRLFGTIVGSAKGRPGSSEAPHVTLSELGRRVLEEEVPKIHRFYPMVEVWRVAIMPDHIHMLVRVNAPLPQGKHLGHVVRGFKTGCSRAWWRWQDEQVGRLGGETPSTTAAEVAAVPEASPSGNRPVLYEQGYHDRFINRPGMLENIKRYMDENPLRARIRQECPRLMERQLHLWIAGREYAAFGNLFLLKYPIKEQVFFHRRDKATGQPTELTEAFHQEHARLLRVAEEGTVLVTPGISKGEQQVVSDALDACLPLILLQKDPIGEYWKPSQRCFYACAAGNLLILSPWNLDGNTDYSRFHQLNDYAREICGATEMRILNYSALNQE
jgi:REP element-mobilizing transposase RayT